MKFEVLKIPLTNGEKFKRKSWGDRYICLEDGKLKTSAMGKSVTWYPTAEELFADDWDIYIQPILMTQFEYDLLSSFDKFSDCIISKHFNDSLVLCDMQDKGYFKNVDPFLAISTICGNVNVIVKEQKND